jgi:hypothetical protein
VRAHAQSPPPPPPPPPPLTSRLTPHAPHLAGCQSSITSRGSSPHSKPPRVAVTPCTLCSRPSPPSLLGATFTRPLRCAELKASFAGGGGPGGERKASFVVGTRSSSVSGASSHAATRPFTVTSRSLHAPPWLLFMPCRRAQLFVQIEGFSHVVLRWTCALRPRCAPLAGRSPDAY